MTGERQSDCGQGRMDGAGVSEATKRPPTAENGAEGAPLENRTRERRDGGNRARC
jgi:hypothetical protein